MLELLPTRVDPFEPVIVVEVPNAADPELLLSTVTLLPTAVDPFELPVTFEDVPMAADPLLPETLVWLPTAVEPLAPDNDVLLPSARPPLLD